VASFPIYTGYRRIYIGYIYVEELHTSIVGGIIILYLIMYNMFTKVGIHAWVIGD
jgi:uncharacterized membrane protein